MNDRYMGHGAAFQNIFQTSAASSAAPDVVVLPSPSARPSRAALAVGDASSSPRQSVRIDQATRPGKHDASLPHYDTPSSESATHLTQLFPAEYYSRHWPHSGEARSVISFLLG